MSRFCFNMECDKMMSDADLLYNGRFCFSCIRDQPYIKVRMNQLVKGDTIRRGVYNTEQVVVYIGNESIILSDVKNGTKYEVGRLSNEIVVLLNYDNKKEKLIKKVL